ncbi:MAG: hypothetical protein K6T66_00795 [Peptococcaceae bacterium]|nr:hypothetical protein [Peptococcaceae bacterium]
MAKINKPGNREKPSKKNPAGETGSAPGFRRGRAFVEENTGSATLINVDGRWDLDHPAGRDK